MEYAIIDTKEAVTFRDLEVGDMFMSDHCIAMKCKELDDCNAVIIKPSKENTAVPAGAHSWWQEQARVYKVKKVTFHLE